MTSGYMITIYYRDGHSEEHYCDSYRTGNGLLIYHVRFGEDSGEHCIPYDLIREFKISR